MLTEYVEQKSAKWQGTVAAFHLLGRMADKAKIGMDTKEVEKNKEVLRESMGKRLARLIPVVENGMHHLKTDVRLSYIDPRCDMLIGDCFHC